LNFLLLKFIYTVNLRYRILSLNSHYGIATWHLVFLLKFSDNSITTALQPADTHIQKKLGL